MRISFKHVRFNETIEIEANLFKFCSDIFIIQINYESNIFEKILDSNRDYYLIDSSKIYHLRKNNKIMSLKPNIISG